MNWTNLSKEQKQMVVLIAVGVIGGLVALYLFVLSPFLSRREAALRELNELKAKIENAEVMLKGKSKLYDEYVLCTGEYNHAVDYYVVPMDNPLSWVTEKVYANARKVGVDVQTVAEVGLASPYWDAAIKAGRWVKPYCVRVVTECSYQHLIDLVAVLEECNPALCITDINISPQDSKPTKHTLNMTLEWPMWGRKLNLDLADTNKPPI